MVVTTRQRIPGQGVTYIKNKNRKRLPIAFDLASLSMMCSYVVSENRNLKRIQYINMRNLIKMLDIDKYINDQEKYNRILFIEKGLEARLARGLSDPEMILNYIKGGFLGEDLINPSELKNLSNNEIDWINETVSKSIKASFVYEECDKHIDLWTRFKAADYRNITEIVAEIEAATAELHTKFRKAKVDSVTDTTFSLSGESFTSSLMDTYSEIHSEFRKLRTGMQGLNLMLDGGFENTRVYLFLGVTGVGKSMTLLDLAYQIKKYNKNFKAKDPTKRPCVVYLTMENSITETIQRLFKIVTGENIVDQESVEEIEYKMRTEGELYLSDESPIDIIIKFRPNKSVDTSYYYTLVEDLEDEGYETICLIQDHAKRIRSTDNNSDIRLELGDVINETKTFAMIKDIPVITNSHVNRDGARVIDENSGKSKADLTRLLGKANVGESLLMLDNVDFAAIINTEYDKDGNKYMAFKEIKTRIECMKHFILIPYLVDNQIKLLEDYYAAVPQYKETLYEAPVMNNTNHTIANNKAIQYDTSIINLDDDSDGIYEFSSRYSSKVVEVKQEDKHPVEAAYGTYKQIIEPFSIVA